jgi:hypothetical protein
MSTEKKNTQVSATDPNTCRALAANPNFVAGHLYASEQTAAHKFSPGQKCRLVGLVSFPQHNGEEVEIEAVREDGGRGRAYYVKGRIAEVALNWVYEYRLEAIS